MRYVLPVLLIFLCAAAYADTPDISIPQHDIDLIKTADDVKAVGTNDLGGAESFEIHDAKAISQFVQLLTTPRYIPVPKSLKPHFKSKSAYDVRMFSRGVQIFELRVVAVSVLDIPGDPSFYMESELHSNVLMAPLLRLR
jgi:hypothetical protein